MPSYDKADIQRRMHGAVEALKQHPKLNASIEDVDLRTPRGLDRALFQKLVAGDWIDRHEGLLVTGPTGIGKSWLACALGQKACRDNHSVLYQRVPRRFADLALARQLGQVAAEVVQRGGLALLFALGARGTGGAAGRGGEPGAALAAPASARCKRAGR